MAWHGIGKGVDGWMDGWVVAWMELYDIIMSWRIARIGINEGEE